MTLTQYFNTVETELKSQEILGHMSLLHKDSSPFCSLDENRYQQVQLLGQDLLGRKREVPSVGI